VTRELGCAALAAVVACAGASAQRRTPVRATPSDAGIAIDAEAEAGPNKLELLSLGQSKLAKGMRETMRRDIDLAQEHELALAAFDVDTCMRAAFDADAPTAVMLVDSHAMTLANVDAAAGTLGQAGPICFRKGDVATFRFTGQSHLRIVVWQSP